jgi:hypothetical protein
VSSEGVEIGAPFALDLLRRAHCVEGVYMFLRLRAKMRGVVLSAWHVGDVDG